MEKFDKQKINHELYECLAKIDSAKEFEALLADLCTPSEVEQMAQRLLCAKLLLLLKKKTKFARSLEKRMSKSIKKVLGAWRNW